MARGSIGLYDFGQNAEWHANSVVGLQDWGFVAAVAE